MATPVAAWGVTSQSAAVSSGDAVPVAPAAGDLVFVSITVANDSGSAPTVTPASGWEVIDNQTFLVYGAYPSRNVLMKKVIGSSEASNLGATFTTNANLITTTDAWGIRGADPASMAISITTNTTDANLMWGSVATVSGALILRLATNHAAAAGYWGSVGPSGHTRLDNKKSVEPNTALYYATATGSATGTAGPSPLSNGGAVIPTFSYTISLADSSGPDVTPPTITSSETPSVIEGSALSHALTADEAVTWTKVGGANSSLFTLTGSTLSLPSQTYPSGPFVVVVRATDAASNWTEQTITVSVTAAPPIRFMDAASGTTTPVLPAHQTGDLLVCFMFRDGNTTAPVTPTGWTSAATGTGTTCSYRLAYKIATSSSESGGTPSTATTCITSVYRPGAAYTLSIGATSQGNGSSTSLTYQSLSMQTTDGSSWVAASAGHRSVNTALETPPTGMVLRATSVDATDEGASFDTNGGVSSWTAKTVSVGGTSSGWVTTTYEIKVAVVGPPPTTGSASVTVSPVSASGAGSSTVTGTGAASTPTTASGQGTSAIAGAGSTATGQTVTAAGDLQITGLASALIASLTLSSAGASSDPEIEGSVVIVLSPWAGDHEGAPLVIGVVSAQVAHVYVDAEGSSLVTGVSSSGVSPVVSSSHAQSTITGAVSATSAPMTLASAGTSQIAGSAALGTAYEAQATGVSSISGAASSYLAGIALEAFGGSGPAPIEGVLSVNLANWLLASAVQVPVSGNAAGSVSVTGDHDGASLVSGHAASIFVSEAAASVDVLIDGQAAGSVSYGAQAHAEVLIGGVMSSAWAVAGVAQADVLVSGGALADVEPLILTSEGIVRALRLGRRITIIVG